jgi:preprotein translocase subunit SecE
MCISVMGKVRQFVHATISELHKCTWPGRKELFESTILVLFAMAILSSFVAVVDLIIVRLLELVTI